MPDPAGRPATSGVSHLGLSVTDLDRSVAFYGDVLGAVIVRSPFPGTSASFSGRMAILALVERGQIVEGLADIGMTRR